MRYVKAIEAALALNRVRLCVAAVRGVLVAMRFAGTDVDRISPLKAARRGSGAPPRQTLLDSAFLVFGPTIPSGARLFCDWNSCTRLLVFGPKIPSG